ncbi:hypothetical protein AX774_g1465 [Zancudomyces culisetae]|uniref:Uncharacterized protein n=1 Tax=Zancudomyces culisetae TaxID=1213189 RepID=A0A1R1PC83_ZANCU|nr:hypothetical protein AX774_g8035 [Zancudomyces culisetae]OMH84990.1 hypothetical protein AX774_g1465 [Zancudomyces culisetae]|eukprot:OMH78576.1 hypothetical protein AX774_g8035 [Zancudomyces culisetae]
MKKKASIRHGGIINISRAKRRIKLEGTELLATTGDMLRLWEYKTIDESDWDKEDEQEECEDEVAFDEIDDDEFMDGEREEEKRGGNQMREGSNMGMDGMAQGGEMDRRNKLHRDVSTGSGDIGNGIERTDREEGGEGKGMMVQWGDKRWDRQKGGESSTSSRKQGIYDRIKLKAGVWRNTGASKDSNQPDGCELCSSTECRQQQSEHSGCANARWSSGGADGAPGCCNGGGVESNYTQQFVHKWNR